MEVKIALQKNLNRCNARRGRLVCCTGRFEVKGKVQSQTWSLNVQVAKIQDRVGYAETSDDNFFQFYHSWLTNDCFQHIRQKSDVLVLGSFRECFQASIVLGHPAAPVLPKSRFDISETHEDLAFDTPLCRQLKLKVKVYRLSSQKWWLSCIWWKQVMGNIGQDDFNWKIWKLSLNQGLMLTAQLGSSLVIDALSAGSLLSSYLP